MEATGAIRIWQRSVEKHNLRYTVVISDGDSKTIKHLNDNRPYGEIEITKHECVGHIQKHLGNLEHKKNQEKGIKAERL